MKYYLLLVLFCTLLNFILLSAASRRPQAQSPKDTPQRLDAVVRSLTNGDMHTLYRLLDAPLRQEISESALQAFWDETRLQYGALHCDPSGICIVQGEDCQTASIPCKFEKGERTLRLRLDEDGAISGLDLTEEDAQDPSR